MSARCWSWLSHQCVAWLLFAPAVAFGAPFAYITNGGSGTVSVIDTATNAVVATAPAVFGALGVAVNAAGTRVYVTDSVLGTLSVIDARTNAVVANVPVGRTPTGVAVNASGTRVYVTNIDSANVSVIDAARDTVVATVPVGASPAGVVTNPPGTRVYVANSDSNTISIIDAATNAVVATLTVGDGPAGLAMNATGTRLYATIDSTNSVAVIDIATNTIVGSIPVGMTPAGVAVNPAGTRVYVANSDSASVSVIDAATNIPIATVAVGTTPTGIGVNPAGTRVYVANFDSNSVSVIDAVSNAVIATIGVGVNPVAFGLFIGPAVAPGANVQGLWWATGGKEPYWGINFAHQGDQVFGTWYTYDTTGKAWWLSTLAGRTAPGSNTYTGPIYVDSGPPFNNFVGAGKPTQIGTATITFIDANSGTFSYSVNAAAAGLTAIAAATAQAKSITRFDLGTGLQPTCTYSAAPNFAAATNYQDLWWATGGTESGWGINFAHQGDSVFATWYTYDVDGTPLWLSVLTTRVGASNVYTGPLYRTSGPRFDAYDPSKAVAQQVGTATLTFIDGNTATLGYTTTGAGGLPAVTQNKAITRFLFAAPAGTVCS